MKPLQQYFHRITVKSPESHLARSRVARYFESCRPKFHDAQKDSKIASQSEMWNYETQVVRFAVIFMEIVNLKQNTKLKKSSNISYSMILTVVFICWSILFWKKVHITTIGTLEKAAILTTARAQESSHDCL